MIDIDRRLVLKEYKTFPRTAPDHKNRMIS